MVDQAPPSSSPEHHAQVRYRLLEWLRHFRPGPGTYVSAFCIGAALAQAVSASGATTPEAAVAGLMSLAAAMGVDRLADLIGDWRPSPEQAPEAMAQEIAQTVQARLARGEGLAAARAVLQHFDALQLAFEAWRQEEDDRWVWLVNELAGQPELIADQTAAKLLPQLSTIEERLACIQRMLEDPRQRLVRSYADEVHRRYSIWRRRYVALSARAGWQPEVPSASSDRDDDFEPSEFGRVGARASFLNVPVEATARDREEQRFSDARAAIATLGDAVLLGDPGAGKSTTLWRLMLERAERAAEQPDAPLPVYVPLGGYDGQTDVIEFVRGQLANATLEVARDKFEPLPAHRRLAQRLGEELACGRLAMCFDGLNEVAQDQRDVAAARLRDFRRDHPGNGFLCTCREEDYHFYFPLPEVRLEPLDDEAIREFIRAYVPEETRALIGHLQNDQSLWEMGRNPYVLRMFVRVYRDGGGLPANRAELFTGFVGELLLREHDRQPHGFQVTLRRSGEARRKALLASLASQWPLLREWNAQPKAFRLEQHSISVREALSVEAGCVVLALSELAYAMGAAGKLGATVSRDFLDRHLPQQLRLDGRSVALDHKRLIYLAHGASLMEQTPDGYRFTHQLLQEYFAAVRLNALGLDDPCVLDCLRYDAWDETVVLLAGLTQEPDVLAERLIPLAPLLAARCTGVAPRRLSQNVAQRLIDALALEALDEYSPWREEAMAALGTTRLREAVAVLNEALACQKASVRCAATGALGGLRLDEAVPLLVERLQDDDANVRWTAVRVLRELQAKEAIPRLVERLQDDDAEVRRAAIVALKALQAKEAIPDVAALLPGADADVRRAVVRALAMLQANEAIPELVACLRDRDLRLRSTALGALQMLQAKEVVPTLLESLRSRDVGLRWTAARALGALQATEAIPELMTLLRDKARWVRWTAVAALGALQASEAIPQLVALLWDEDCLVSGAAIDALKSLHAREAIPELLAWLCSRGRRLRLVAVEALAALQAREAIPQLVARLADDDAGVRRAAAAALGALQAREAIPQLVARLADDDADVRRAATGALGALQATEAIPELMTLLRDKARWVRREAILALQALEAREAIPQLMARLADDDAGVRRAAVVSLRELQAKEAIPQLMTRLADGDAFVRRAAVRSLRELQAKQAITVLVARLADDDADVRRAAVDALVALQAREAIPLILARVPSLSAEARPIAVRALRALRASEATPALTILGVAGEPAAWEVLAEVGSRDTVPVLQMLSEHPDAHVRMGALRAYEAARRAAGLPRTGRARPPRAARSSLWALVRLAEGAESLIRNWSLAVTVQAKSLRRLDCASAALAALDSGLSHTVEGTCDASLPPNVALEKAASLRALGRREEALAVACAVRDQAGNSAKLLTGVADLLVLLGKPEEASLLYGRCVEPSEQAGYRRNLAEWRIFQGDYERAEEDIASAAESEPWHPITFGRRGQLALAQGRFTEALAAFKQAARRDPHAPVWQYDVAFARLGLALPDALATFDAALERTALHEQVEGALRDLSILERTQPDLPELEELRDRLAARRQYLTELAERELHEYLASKDAGPA